MEIAGADPHDNLQVGFAHGVALHSDQAGHSLAVVRDVHRLRGAFRANDRPHGGFCETYQFGFAREIISVSDFEFYVLVLFKVVSY